MEGSIFSEPEGVDAFRGSNSDQAVLRAPKPGEARDGMLVQLDAGSWPNVIAVLQVPAPREHEQRPSTLKC